jgi:phage/conjugal plasmid C-4 type zinc finger TraR family protein
MAGGWTNDDAVQNQIDASIEDAVHQARSRLSSGKSRTHCEECEEAIPEARRQAIPGVQLCISCQSQLEKQQTASSAYNRRGSKGSQLK